MKILMWSNSYRPQIGGVEVFLAELGPALRARGHEVAVITDMRGPDPEQEVIDGVEVRRLAMTQALESGRPAEVIRMVRGASDAVRELAPDVVHVNFADATIFFYLRSAAAHQAPMALTFHVAPPPVVRERSDGMVRRAMLAAGRVTACSQATLDDALAITPEAQERSSVLPYGLAIPDFDPGATPDGDPVVFSAARLVPEKGFDVLIDAMPLLREQVPGARLTIAGDGPERPALQAQARVLGVEREVELEGWTAPPAMWERYAEAPVTAVPSRWREPFCIVAMQAATMGRAVVASRVGGLPETVLDGETGLLVEPESPHALAEALAGLLRDRGRAEELGRAARERALRDFTLERCAERYEAVFEEVL